MRRRDFLNRLKVLRALDLPELIEAGVIDANGHGWTQLRDNPAAWLMRADDEAADKLWALVEQRAGAKPRPYPHAGSSIGKVGEVFVFEACCLTIQTQGHGQGDGEGRFFFAEDDLSWEQDDESPKAYRAITLPADELIFLRDKLNEVFPR
jgi:hypothetical protein